jgi:transposase InsO family protein
VPQRHRRKRLGASTTPNPPTADAPNKVWAADFQFDATTDGRPIKIVSIVDEHTRECLGGLVDRSLTGDDLTDELDRIVRLRGYPAVLRCDIHSEWRADGACGSGRPRRFIGDRRSSVTAAIAIGAAWVDSLPVDRGGGRGPRRRGASPVRNLMTPPPGSAAGAL